MRELTLLVKPFLMHALLDITYCITVCTHVTSLRCYTVMRIKFIVIDNYSSVYLSRYYSRVLIFLNDTGYLSYHGVDI